MKIHHITHIDNLNGIITNGLLCRNSLKGFSVSFTDTADPNIILERKGLNNYVPFHINLLQEYYGIPYNYAVFKNYGKENMIFLIKEYTSYNSSDLLYGYHPLSEFNKNFFNIDDYKNFFTSEYEILPKQPQNQNNIDFSNNQVKQFLMSEVLICNSVPFKDIKEIVVFDNNSKIRVVNILKQHNIQFGNIIINPIFFR